MADPLIDQYRELHKTRRYGTTATRNVPFLAPLVARLKPTSVIDFGCGQARLLKHLSVPGAQRLVSYDPAIPRHASRPEGPFDLLINIDVLEHIEEPDLDAVIAEMRALSPNAILVVDTVPAKQILPDGRNAHVTVRSRRWWRRRLARHYPVLVPIRVASWRRAAFRTWKEPGEVVALTALRLHAARVADHLAWAARWLVRRVRRPAPASLGLVFSMTIAADVAN